MNSRVWVCPLTVECDTCVVHHTNRPTATSMMRGSDYLQNSLQQKKLIPPTRAVKNRVFLIESFGAKYDSVERNKNYRFMRHVLCRFASPKGNYPFIGYQYPLVLSERIS
nr:unnamed protein product [Fasciola hepatica]